MNLNRRIEVMVDLAAQENIKSMDYRVPDIMPTSIFRTYDIRGPVEKDFLTVDVAYAVGLAIGSMARKKNIQQIIVGRDGRISGPELKQALCTGLNAAGVDIIDIGIVPSPLLYFATNRLQTNTGVMITASHNPANHNGFKIVMDGETLSSAGVQNVLQCIQARNFTQGSGDISQQDIIDDYISYVTDRIHLAKPLKIVIDCGNGVAAVLAEKLYRQLGCSVEALFCEVDGRFPNHHPDPTIATNLQDLINKVKATHADIGLAFDGDADRLGVITNTGEIIWPDRQMMLFATEVLANHPGAEIVFDVKCTNHLPKIILQQGGRPVMYRTGHSILKNKMLELGAPLAGEMSGHIFFNDEWFGFDDGLYVGARLLRILAKDGRKLSDIFADFPTSINTPELKLPMAEDKKIDFMNRLLIEGKFGEVERITIDGLRVDFGYGWGLIRLSNTSPYLILRFEAETESQLEEIKNVFRRELLKLDNALMLPF